MDVSILTLELIKHLHTLKENYENNEAPKDRRDHTFFSFVKQQTEPIYKLVEDWESKALEIVKLRKTNVHPQQIVSTRENIELLLMHSYYIDVRRRRYMEIYTSILYVLNQLQSDMENSS